MLTSLLSFFFIFYKNNLNFFLWYLLIIIIWFYISENFIKKFDNLISTRLRPRSPLTKGIILPPPPSYLLYTHIVFPSLSHKFVLWFWSWKILLKGQILKWLEWRGGGRAFNIKKQQNVIFIFIPPPSPLFFFYFCLLVSIFAKDNFTVGLWIINKKFHSESVNTIEYSTEYIFKFKEWKKIYIYIYWKFYSY